MLASLGCAPAQSLLGRSSQEEPSPTTSTPRLRSDLTYSCPELEDEYATRLARQRASFRVYDVFRVVGAALVMLRAQTWGAILGLLAAGLGCGVELDAHMRQRGSWRRRGVLTVVVNVANLYYASFYHSVALVEPASPGPLRTAVQAFIGSGGVLLQMAAQGAFLPWTWRLNQQVLLCTVWLVNVPRICAVSDSMRTAYAWLHAALVAMLRPAGGLVRLPAGLQLATGSDWHHGVARSDDLQVCIAYEQASTVVGFLLSCALTHWMACKARESFLRQRQQGTAPAKPRSWRVCARDAAPLVFPPLYCFLAFILFYWTQ